MKRLLLGIAALVATSCGVDVNDDSAGLRAAVSIETQGCQPIQLGSGVVIDDDLVLTAAHVVEGAVTVETTTADGITHEAVPVLIDTDRDFALLHVAGLDVEPARIAEGRVDETSAIAAPRSSSRLTPAPLVRVVWASTTDIHRSRDVLKLVLELEFVSGSGDSGAAILDGSGAVVGVLMSSARGRDVSFALHVEEFRPFLDNVTKTRAPRGSCSR